MSELRLMRIRMTFGLIRLQYLRRSGVPLVRLGSDYGGWYVPATGPAADWIVYSVGVGEDVTFDVELIRRFGCTVHAFDPTPRARAHVMAIRDLDPRFHFHAYGLWHRDEVVRFYSPRDPRHVSHSIHNLQETTSYFDGQVKRLRTAMAELGHERIDLLKMDIEGAEYEVLADLVSSNVRPKVICVECERLAYLPNRRLISSLVGAGYRLVKMDGRNLTFLYGS